MWTLFFFICVNSLAVITLAVQLPSPGIPRQDEPGIVQAIAAFKQNSIDVNIIKLQTLIPSKEVPAVVKEGSIGDYLWMLRDFCLHRSCDQNMIFQQLIKGNQAYYAVKLLTHEEFLEFLSYGAPAICKFFPVSIMESISGCNAVVEARKKEISELIKWEAEKLLMYAREYVKRNSMKQCSRNKWERLHVKQVADRSYPESSEDYRTILGCPENLLKQLWEKIGKEIIEDENFFWSFKKIANPHEDVWDKIQTQDGPDFLDRDRILEKALDLALPGWK